MRCKAAERRRSIQRKCIRALIAQGQKLTIPALRAIGLDVPLPRSAAEAAVCAWIHSQYRIRHFPRHSYCYKCQRVLEISVMVGNGKGNRCRACNREMQAERWAEKTDKMRQYMQEYAKTEKYRKYQREYYHRRKAAQA